ncbi:MAG: divalent cation transporter [Candidatus Aenigmarchaeota archaeon]|nr:divalent cation transporter [Candidatus Aenigmarchaeota archaeon]
MPVTRSVWRIVEETTPLVVGFAVLELIAGGILGAMIIDIELLPGLFILIPALLDMRGSIGSSLGARMNSGLHLGYIKPGKVTKALRANIYSALILSFILSVILSVFATLACSLYGVMCVTFIEFFLISVIAGISSGIVLIFLAIFISNFSYKKGLDPDDITSPTIGTTGDIVTVICLFLAVKLVLGLGI